MTSHGVEERARAMMECPVTRRAENEAHAGDAAEGRSWPKHFTLRGACRYPSPLQIEGPVTIVVRPSTVGKAWPLADISLPWRCETLWSPGLYHMTGHGKILLPSSASLPPPPIYARGTKESKAGRVSRLTVGRAGCFGRRKCRKASLAVAHDHGELVNSLNCTECRFCRAIGRHRASADGWGNNGQQRVFGSDGLELSERVVFEAELWSGRRLCIATRGFFEVEAGAPAIDPTALSKYPRRSYGLTGRIVWIHRLYSAPTSQSRCLCQPSAARSGRQRGEHHAHHHHHQQ